MIEQQVQKKILDYLKKEGHYAVKVIAASRKGVPDILACVNGHFIGLEVKLPGRTASPLQIHNLEKIRQSGGKAYVVYDLKEVKAILKEIVHDHLN